jgi:hypothetical protein
VQVGIVVKEPDHVGLAAVPMPPLDIAELGSALRGLGVGPTAKIVLDVLTGHAHKVQAGDRGRDPFLTVLKDQDDDAPFAGHLFTDVGVGGILGPFGNTGFVGTKVPGQLPDGTGALDLDLGVRGVLYLGHCETFLWSIGGQDLRVLLYQQVAETSSSPAKDLALWCTIRYNRSQSKGYLKSSHATGFLLARNLSR